MSAVSRMELAAEVPLVFSGVMRLIWGGWESILTDHRFPTLLCLFFSLAIYFISKLFSNSNWIFGSEFQIKSCFSADVSVPVFSF